MFFFLFLFLLPTSFIVYDIFMMKMIPSRELTYPRRLPFPGTLELMIEHS